MYKQHLHIQLPNYFEQVFFPFIHNKEPFSAFVIWSKAANIYVILLNIPILTKHLTKCIGIVFVYALK